MQESLIITINPGSTSTKYSLFQGEQELFTTNLSHSTEELAVFPRINDQLGFRKELILWALKKSGVSLDQVAAVVGRGGLLKPIPSGVYEVNEVMIRDLLSPETKEHASNL